MVSVLDSLQRSGRGASIPLSLTFQLDDQQLFNTPPSP
ncbi:hypothetical protein SAMN04515668_3742 [Hymenobacter arizonensis]|uniref:Uncharacterized protein n=1 Tax=Hymenobacter arizonensis TaxID=1227077 RepID=A0A1I6AJB4_HYMAR|nr:hypothetical protein SAMN04515668_3742 [Hymenobacter arizonensis]